MNISSTLSDVVKAAQSEIRDIGKFASDTESRLTIEQAEKPDVPFTPDEIKQLRTVGNALIEAVNGEQVHAQEIACSDRVGNFIHHITAPIRHRSFLAEMSLSYLISHQEAFVKDYLLELLVNNNQLLISNNTLTYEELFRHNSISSVWKVLAQKEVDALGYGSIDDVSTYFQKKLGIDLTKFPHWKDLREHSYRRNLIIHNRGRINEIYRKKTGCKGDILQVTTEMDYVSFAVSNISAFIDYVHRAVCSKFRLSILDDTNNGAEPHASDVAKCGITISSVGRGIDPR